MNDICCSDLIRLTVVRSVKVAKEIIDTHVAADVLK